VFTAALAWPSIPASGQISIRFDPSLTWQTLETEHFRIHFHEGLEGVAYLTAKIAEESYATIKDEFGEAPTKIDLVLTDPFDFSNGFANPLGDEVVIFASQYRLSSWANMRLDSWWHMVTFHELVHAVDLDQARGLNAFLKRIFGEIVVPNFVKPVPFVEGLAVYEKYKHLGESRLNDSKTRMMLRQMVLDNALPRFDEITSYYTRERWPIVGLLVYNYGSWLMRYIEETYGEDALARFNAVNAGKPLNLLWLLGFGENFKRVLKEALGVTPEELYQGFKAWLREEFEPEITHIESQGLTGMMRLTTLGFFTDAPAWSPQDDWIAYTHSGPGRAGLRLITPEGEGDHEVVPGGLASYPTWSPDGQALVYTKLDFKGPFYIHSDLYRYDLETGKEERLTWGERAYYARYSPDGQKIYYAKNFGHDGSTALAVLDLETGNTRVLKAFPENSGVIHSFAISPDGKTMALALWRWGGYQDLYLLSLEELGASGEPELRAATQDQNQVSDPTWSPDGQYVLFSADPDRVYNIYAYRVSDGKFFRVTNVLTGAFYPTISPQGDRIAFVSYSSDGYDLYTMSYDPAQWAPIEFPKGTPPTWEGFPRETSYPVRPYDPTEHLAPLFWLPVPVPGGLGIVTAGMDPLFQHNYFALLGWDFEAGQPFYELGYVNMSYATIALTAGANRDGDYQGLSVEIPLLLSAQRQQALSLGYAREAHSASSASHGKPEEANEAEGESEREPQEPYVKHSFSGGYRYTRARSQEFFRDVTTLSVQGRLFTYEGERIWHHALEVNWREFFRLPIPESHWVSLRLQAAWTDSDKEPDKFSIGGPYGPYAVRGFPQDALAGQQAIAASVQYEFPLFAIERGVGGWPVFLDDLEGRLFIDAGLAGDSLDLDELKVGFGAELSLSLTLGYFQPAAAIVGVAQGLGEPQPAIYVNFEMPGLF
jgi:Tol biopolymer transport system component